MGVGQGDQKCALRGRESDVLEHPYAVGGGGLPLPPLLPFQCLRLTAKFLLRRLRCQEDLRPKDSGFLGGGGPRRPEMCSEGEGK